MIRVFRKVAENWLGQDVDNAIMQTRSVRDNTRQMFERLIDDETDYNDVQGAINLLLEESEYATPEEQDEIYQMLRLLGYQQSSPRTVVQAKLSEHDEALLDADPLLVWLSNFDKKAAVPDRDPETNRYLEKPLDVMNDESSRYMDSYGDWASLLDDDQFSSLTDYVANIGQNFYINQKNQFWHEDDPDEEAALEHMDSLINLGSVPEDTVAYRGTDYKDYIDAFDNGTLIGSEFKVPTYASTSLYFDMALDFASSREGDGYGIVFDIFLPEGQAAAFIPAYSQHQADQRGYGESAYDIDPMAGQEEVLLPRDLTYRVTDAWYDDNNEVRRASLEIINPSTEFEGEPVTAKKTAGFEIGDTVIDPDGDYVEVVDYDESDGQYLTRCYDMFGDTIEAWYEEDELAEEDGGAPVERDPQEEAEEIRDMLQGQVINPEYLHKWLYVNGDFYFWPVMGIYDAAGEPHHEKVARVLGVDEFSDRVAFGYFRPAQGYYPIRVDGYPQNVSMEDVADDLVGRTPGVEQFEWNHEVTVPVVNGEIQWESQKTGAYDDDFFGRSNDQRTNDILNYTVPEPDSQWGVVIGPQVYPTADPSGYKFVIDLTTGKGYFWSGTYEHSEVLNALGFGSAYSIGTNPVSEDKAIAGYYEPSGYDGHMVVEAYGEDTVFNDDTISTITGFFPQDDLELKWNDDTVFGAVKEASIGLLDQPGRDDEGGDFNRWVFAGNRFWYLPYGTQEDEHHGLLVSAVEQQGIEPEAVGDYLNNVYDVISVVGGTDVWERMQAAAPGSELVQAEEEDAFVYGAAPFAINDRVTFKAQPDDEYFMQDLDGMGGYVIGTENKRGDERVVVQFDGKDTPHYIPLEDASRLVKDENVTRPFIFVISEDGRVERNYTGPGNNDHNELARALGANPIIEVDEYMDEIDTGEVDEFGFARGVWDGSTFLVIPEWDPDRDEMPPELSYEQLAVVSDYIREIGQENITDIIIEDAHGEHDPASFRTAAATVREDGTVGFEGEGLGNRHKFILSPDGEFYAWGKKNEVDYGKGMLAIENDGTMWDELDDFARYEWERGADDTYNFYRNNGYATGQTSSGFFLVNAPSGLNPAQVEAVEMALREHGPKSIVIQESGQRNHFNNLADALREIAPRRNEEPEEVDTSGFFEGTPAFEPEWKKEAYDYGYDEDELMDEETFSNYADPDQDRKFVYDGQNFWFFPMHIEHSDASALYLTDDKDESLFSWGFYYPMDSQFYMWDTGMAYKPKNPNIFSLIYEEQPWVAEIILNDNTVYQRDEKAGGFVETSYE